MPEWKAERAVRQAFQPDNVSLERLTYRSRRRRPLWGMGRSPNEIGKRERQNRKLAVLATPCIPSSDLYEIAYEAKSNRRRPRTRWNSSLLRVAKS